MARCGRSHRFTMIELMIVIAIIVIMIAALLPALGTARERTRRVKCIANLKQVGLALRSYAADHQDYFPESNNALGLMRLLEFGYLESASLFRCPSAGTDPDPDPLGGITDPFLDYVFRGGFTESSSTPDTGIACDRIMTPNHDQYGSVLFGDGHVVGFTGLEWATQKRSHNVIQWPADPH